MACQSVLKQNTTNVEHLNISLRNKSFNQQRRQILQSVGVFFAAHSFNLSAEVLNQGAPSNSEKTTLAAFVDVLIPKDRFTGSATDLQVDVQLWALADSSEKLRQLLAAGCEWLNQTGGPPFSELKYKQQYKLVAWMAESDWENVPRLFYEIVRSSAMRFYYAQPAAWDGLAIDRPPQPVGYSPPWQ
jgi:hypothetical protein